MHRKAPQANVNNAFKTPEKRQPVPRDYSPGKKPVMNIVLSQAELPKLKLF